MRGFTVGLALALASVTTLFLPDVCSASVLFFPRSRGFDASSLEIRLSARGLAPVSLKRLPNLGAWMVEGLEARACEEALGDLGEVVDGSLTLRASFSPSSRELSDPLSSDQWHLGFCRFPEAFALASSLGEGVVVAVMDTGVDLGHPDLAGSLWVNPHEVPGNGVDDDGDGFVDDVHGANVLSGGGDVSDLFGHGTKVAGLIAASANGEGVLGCAPRSKLMVVKASEGGSLTLADLARAFDYVIGKRLRGIDVRLINLSFNTSPYSSPQRDYEVAIRGMIERAFDAGITLVSSAGNDGADLDSRYAYPTSVVHPGHISVAAVDFDGKLAQFSNRGYGAVWTAAPGVEMLTTSRGGGYARADGTSFSAPVVCGALALLFGLKPHLGPTEAKEALMSSVREGYQVPSVRSGGVLDALALISTEASPAPSGGGGGCRAGTSWPGLLLGPLSASFLLLIWLGRGS